MAEQQPKCECGADIVYVNGKPWCAKTLARYRAMYGEPRGLTGVH